MSLLIALVLVVVVVEGQTPLLVDCSSVLRMSNYRPLNQNKVMSTSDGSSRPRLSPLPRFPPPPPVKDNSPPAPPLVNPASSKKARVLAVSNPLLSNSSSYYPTPMSSPSASPSESPPGPPPPPLPPSPEESYSAPSPLPEDSYSAPPPPPHHSHSAHSSRLTPSGSVSEQSYEEYHNQSHTKHNCGFGIDLGIIVVVLILILAASFTIYYICVQRKQSSNIEDPHATSTLPNLVIGAKDNKHTDSSPAATTSSESKFIGFTGGSSVNMSSISSTSSSTLTTQLGTPKTRSFTLEELSEATDNFSNSNILGQGGFGKVYKGILPSGKVVAIKQLRTGSVQGEREFVAEIETITCIHHKNLVSLVGYSIQGDERLLVYEFMANNSLAYHLHAPEAETLTWDVRMQIAIGSAKGLAYLHEDCEPKIIHRDIKACNILLDSKYKAKVSDFGLAKFIAEDITHISTRIMGTLGYLAPEYASNGKLTEKSDVYSFGVVLLELLSGRNAIDLLDWARPKLSTALENDIYDELVDPKLGKQYNIVEMRRMVACARASIHPYAQNRPQMIEIARVLQGVLSPADLNVGRTVTTY